MAPLAVLRVYEEDAKSMVTENQSPDVPFRWSVNPYRGCFHGCAYCYARPTHQYLDFGAGTDFERNIVVKRNAAQLLRAKLLRKSWRGETVVFSGVTDCYQPLEASYGLTRACLEVCAEFRQPVGIITKGARYQLMADLFANTAKRLGMIAPLPATVPSPFRRPHREQWLFGPEPLGSAPFGQGETA